MERRTQNVQTMCDMSIEALDELAMDILVYTDGSVQEDGIIRGGAGVVVTSGKARRPEVLHK